MPVKSQPVHQYCSSYTTSFIKPRQRAMDIFYLAGGNKKIIRFPSAGNQKNTRFYPASSCKKFAILEILLILYCQ